MKDVFVYHAATDFKEGNWIANGGRVLGVTAMGDTIAQARDLAYEAVNMISCQGEYHRTDIASQAINK